MIVTIWEYQVKAERVAEFEHIYSSGISSLVDFYTIMIAIISLVLLLRYKVNSTWLIAAGGIAGFIFSFIR